MQSTHLSIADKKLLKEEQPYNQETMGKRLNRQLSYNKIPESRKVYQEHYADFAVKCISQNLSLSKCKTKKNNFATQIIIIENNKKPRKYSRNKSKPRRTVNQVEMKTEKFNNAEHSQQFSDSQQFENLRNVQASKTFKLV